MNDHTTVSASITTAVVTGVAAGLPAQAVSYGEKVLGVFVLAVVAELARRLVSLLWKGKKS